MFMGGKNYTKAQFTNNSHMIKDVQCLSKIWQSAHSSYNAQLIQKEIFNYDKYIFNIPFYQKSSINTIILQLLPKSKTHPYSMQKRNKSENKEIEIKEIEMTKLKFSKLKSTKKEKD